MLTEPYGGRIFTSKYLSCTSGGKGLRPMRKERGNSEAFVSDAFGVLFLTLSEGSYARSFVSTSSETLDSDRGSCR